MSEIIIKNLKVFAYHGVHKKEKQNGQNFYIDITANINTKESGFSDNLKDTVSYSDIIKCAVKCITSGSYNLIEKAAEITASEILNNFKKIKAVEVTLKKPEAPIDAKFEYVAVKIVKIRDDNK